MNNRQIWADAVRERIPHAWKIQAYLESTNWEAALRLLQELAKGGRLFEAQQFVRWNMTQAEAWNLNCIVRGETLCKLQAGEQLQAVFTNQRPNRELRDWLGVWAALENSKQHTGRKKQC